MIDDIKVPELSMNARYVGPKHLWKSDISRKIWSEVGKYYGREFHCLLILTPTAGIIVNIMTRTKFHVSE